ncbi:hypothetical protein GGX14DRAFT_562806 [Mycena pura]|uniref:Uncharacterized protein n=1 Tax=Mycena pura TaxID=153505 RepID=A0AAD6YJK4_9AGAR|nr:hypothetical protein GGX14DRAFT_562806 [Mycena pura]
MAASSTFCLMSGDDVMRALALASVSSALALALGDSTGAGGAWRECGDNAAPEQHTILASEEHECLTRVDASAALNTAFHDMSHLDGSGLSTRDAVPARRAFDASANTFAFRAHHRNIMPSVRYAQRIRSCTFHQLNAAITRL